MNAGRTTCVLKAGGGRVSDARRLRHSRRFRSAVRSTFSRRSAPASSVPKSQISEPPRDPPTGSAWQQLGARRQRVFDLDATGRGAAGVANDYLVSATARPARPSLAPLLPRTLARATGAERRPGRRPGGIPPHGWACRRVRPSSGTEIFSVRGGGGGRTWVVAMTFLPLASTAGPLGASGRGGGSINGCAELPSAPPNRAAPTRQIRPGSPA